MNVPEELRAQLDPHQLVELGTAMRNVEQREGDPAGKIPAWLTVIFPRLGDVARGLAITEDLIKHDALRREIK